MRIQKLILSLLFACGKISQTHCQNILQPVEVIPVTDLATATTMTDMKPEVLAPASSSSTSTSKKKGNDDEDDPVASFIIGLIMVIAAFPTIWMNERRQVRQFKFIKKAEASCNKVENANKIDDSLDY